MTLLDEAELVTAVKGLHVLYDVLRGSSGDFIGGFSDANQQVSNFWSKVIPDHLRWADNYLSEVGLLHSDAANVMLWRATATRPPSVAHGYAYYWYQQTIANPLPELMGHRWSFERNSIPGQPPTASYYLQDLNSAISELSVNTVSGNAATALVGLHVVTYPDLQSFKGLSAVGKNVQGVYLNTIQYSGNMIANFAATVSLPTGSPVYLGTAGSTPAFYVNGSNSNSSSLQATWDYQFSLQPGTPQPQSIKSGLRTKAVSSETSPNAVYTIIPVHVPNEAVGISFEYQVAGAGVNDFMTMGISDQNNYTMEAKFVDDAVWNGTPVIQISSFRNQDIQLVFALNGSDAPPTGTLSIRNIQFFIPPRPELNIAMIGQHSAIAWPLSATEWTLELSTNLSDPNGWQAVNGAPSDTDYFHTINFDIGTSTRAFFRLRK